MLLLRYTTGETVTISAETQVGAGGEARILPVVSQPDLVAKLYHRPEPDQKRKLIAMLANPPEDPMAGDSHISIAWPIDHLSTCPPNSRFVGYLMPRVVNTLPVFQYYNPASRRRHNPLFSYRYLLRAARNLAAAVRALHQRGYVIGDMNESNILVTPTALVTLVDTDSFQVQDTGATYRCTVGKPEYTPPEIQGRSFADLDRLPQHDLFGLAVLIFQLLMEGTHPFAGAYLGAGEPPVYFQRISEGHFPYAARSVPFRPTGIAPPFDMLYPAIRNLLLRCFDDGHRDPAARPDAQAWMLALQEAEDSLITCSANAQHLYGAHLDNCPWCERKLIMAGRDPFPSAEDVEKRRHLTQHVRRQAPASTPIRFAQSAYVTSYSAPYAPHPPSIWLTLMNFQLPANPWSWSALVAGLMSVGAYLHGSSEVSITLAAAAVLAAIGAQVVAIKTTMRGKWLAGLCLPAALFTGFDAGADLHTLRYPPDVRTIRLYGGVRSVDISHNGDLVVTGTNRVEDQRLIGGQVGVWYLKSGKLKDALAQYAGNVTSVRFTPSAASIAVASYAPMQDGHVDMLDAEYPDVKTTIATIGGSQPSEAMSADGKRIAVGNLSGGIQVIEIAGRRVTARCQVKGEALALAFSPDGSRLAVASGSAPGSILPGAITVLDTQSGDPLWSIPCHGNAALTVAFSPDGASIASGGNDSNVLISNSATGRPIQTYDAHTVRTEAIAYSDDGRLLAEGAEPAGPNDANYNIVIRDTASWRPVRTLVGHTGRITSLAFAPNGRTLVSGALDCTLRLWRL